MNSVRLSFYLGMFAVALFGIFCFSVGVYQVRKSTSAVKWPTVEGIVLSAKVRRLPKADGRSRGNYRPDIEYQYCFNGKTFKNDKIYFFEAGLSKTASQSFVCKYAPGNYIKVFYNPNNPSESVLEPKLSWRGYALVFIGVAMFALVYGMFRIRNSDLLGEPALDKG